MNKDINKHGLLNKNYIFVVIGSVMLYMSTNSFAISIPKIALTLSEDSFMIGALTASYTLSSCLTRILWGKLADKKSCKLVVILGILLSAISIPILMINSIVTLFLSRILFGIGFAGASTAYSILATDTVEKPLIPKAIAIFSMGGVIVQAFAMPLGLYLFNKGLIYLAISSSVFLIISIILTIFLSSEKKDTLNKPKPKAKVTPTAIKFSILGSLITFTTASIISFLPIMQKNNSDISTSYFYITTAIGMLLSRLLFIKLKDAIKIHHLFMFGGALMSTGFVLLGIFTNPTIFLIIGLCYGTGLGTMHTILNVKAIEHIDNRTQAISVFWTFQDFGITFGGITFGILAQKFSFPVIFYISATIILFVVIVFKKINNSNN